MTDAETTLGELRERVREFTRARAWERYHTPKNLVMALAVEAAELVEPFQWLAPDEIPDRLRDSEFRQGVEEEMADVLCYLLSLANVLDVNLGDAVRAKMQKNAQKYPEPEERARESW